MRTMTRGALAGLVVLAGCAWSQPAPTRFGVVALTAKRELCVVLSTPVPVGERLVIANLHPQAFVPARAGRPVADCGLGFAAGHAYRLTVDGSEDQLSASTAVVGDVPPGLTFKDCSGPESVQLTVWRGAQRIWHGTYQVDYELEPTCAAGELPD